MPSMNVADLLGANPPIPLEMPTRESLLAEAAAMGDRFSEVTSHPGDLLADAEEMLEARDDVPNLVKRGYKVSDGQFERVRLLKSELAPRAAAQEQLAQASQLNTAAAEADRQQLLDLRSEIASIGKAAGLPASLFSLETRKTMRLNVVLMRMEEVLENVHEYRSKMPDQERLDALTIQARTILDRQKDSRRHARLMRTERSMDGRMQERLERLLLDTMQYLSAQGLAAYPKDPVREPRYRLDHVYGTKPSKVADPGAGGTTGG